MSNCYSESKTIRSADSTATRMDGNKSSRSPGSRRQNDQRRTFGISVLLVLTQVLTDVYQQVTTVTGRYNVLHDA